MRSVEHDLLIEKAEQWLSYKVTLRGMCWATEVSIDGSNYIPDGIALACLQNRFCQYYTSGFYGEKIFVFDSKVSKSDYINSKPAKGIIIGDLHWIIASRFLLKPEDITEPWGLLQKSNRGLTEIKKPTYTFLSESSSSEVYKVSHAILWAQHHVPRRERHRRIMEHRRKMEREIHWP